MGKRTISDNNDDYELPKRKRIKTEKNNNDQHIWDKLNSYENQNQNKNKNKNYNDNDEWVSGTAIRNYMLNDPLIDWLDRYYDTLGFNDNNTIIKLVDKSSNNKSILFKNGLIFEDAVFEELKYKFPEDCVQVGYTRQDVNNIKYQETINYMKNGVPIIMQAVLINSKNKTRGLADLLIRSDYINKFFGENQLIPEEENIPATKLKIPFHYRVIDIKWTTLHLCSNGKLIRNSDSSPAYKGQLAIYNCILGNVQGYFPNKAYILGHSWKYEMCKSKYRGFSCFDLLGHIDYSNFDKQYIDKTIEAINWVRILRREGKDWKLIPPSRLELYPNMSNRNDYWSEVKNIISSKIHELTDLWQVGPKNRKIGHSHNIYEWIDKRCNAKNLGINGKKIGPILDKIIKINQSDKSIIKPSVIKNNEMNWQLETELDFFIDFETVNGCFIHEPTNIYDNRSESNIIFLIGVGYLENGLWKYKSFSMDKLLIENEKGILDEWMKFIDSYRNKSNKSNKSNKFNGYVKFFHWGNAEATSINIANKRHQYRWSAWLKNIVWIDLCKIFQNEPIVIKGSLKFKLKDIAKSMYHNGLIKTTWNLSEINDGLSAMVDAIDYYNHPENNKKMEQIKKYNEIDCKVIWEIVEYLRHNHI